MKIMMIKMKKWLYGVALGALLVAGNAAGVTVHEVLSNDFWSMEQRGTRENLAEVTGERGPKQKKYQRTFDQDTWIEKIESCYVYKGPLTDKTRWKEKEWSDVTDGRDFYIYDSVVTLTDQRPIYREKTITKEHYESQGILDTYYSTNRYVNTQITYTGKPRQANVRPTGPYVVDDWFPDAMTTKSYQECRFFGTEHTAVTNVISDNEAYITGTISQTGHIDKYKDKKVDQPASLLRTYTQHITTDANHVYVEQEITENTQNDPVYNSQNTYQTQYTATFKKGRWKGEKETISKVSQRDITSWCLKQLQNEKN